MKTMLWIASILALSMAPTGNAASARGPIQSETTQAANEAAARAEYEAARNNQAQQLEAIRALTAQAESAKEATKVAELRANQFLQLAKSRLQAAQARAAQAEKNVADATSAEEQTRWMADLAAAQSDHASASDLLTQIQSETKQAQDYYQALSDAQANAALQDYVVGNMSGYGSSPAQSRDYWIGVQCEPALEVQVRMDPNSDRLVTVKGGLRVNAVTADSPAKTAGLVEQDVILFMNDKPTNQIEELVAVIDENGEKSASLQVVRDQLPMTLSITPLKRPQNEATQGPVDLQNQAQWLGYPGPPHIYAAAEAPKLPAGYVADVHFAPDANPEFTIKSSNDKWSVNGENIDQLPEEVRPFARHVWSTVGGSAWWKWRASPYLHYYAADAFNSAHRYSPTLSGRGSWAGQVEGANSATDAKIDQLQKQLNELRELIERREK